MHHLVAILFLYLFVNCHLVVAQASNAITVPIDGFNVTAGEPVTIEWTDLSQTYVVDTCASLIYFVPLT